MSQLHKYISYDVDFSLQNYYKLSNLSETLVRTIDGDHSYDDEIF